MGIRIPDIQPSHQGRYWCRAQGQPPGQGGNRSSELLVYYVPTQHPDCLWRAGQDPSEAQQFTCSWPGAYPAPSLRWADVHQGQDTRDQDHIYVVEQTDSLVVSLNRSQLSEGQTLKCIAEHQVLLPDEDKSCLLHLKLPFPEGKPLVTALEQTDVTLSCSEARSIPPANTTWRRGVQQDPILPGPRYLLVQDGPEIRLTIHNLTKEDQGVYFCRSQNPLGVRELEVYLTVKASSALTGIIIGVFLAALITGVGVVTAKLLYSSRDRICLGNGFGRMEEEHGDVISLVDSEDEVFQPPVPRLPPASQTTSVQIHAVPADVEETGCPAPGPQQQDNLGHFEDPLQLIKF